jgi:hypothetical protein
MTQYLTVILIQSVLCLNFAIFLNLYLNILQTSLLVKVGGEVSPEGEDLSYISPTTIVLYLNSPKPYVLYPTVLTLHTDMHN